MPFQGSLSCPVRETRYNDLQRSVNMWFVGECRLIREYVVQNAVHIRFEGVGVAVTSDPAMSEVILSATLSFIESLVVPGLGTDSLVCFTDGEFLSLSSGTLLV